MEFLASKKELQQSLGDRWRSKDPDKEVSKQETKRKEGEEGKKKKQTWTSEIKYLLCSQSQHKSYDTYKIVLT